MVRDSEILNGTNLAEHFLTDVQQHAKKRFGLLPSALDYLRLDALLPTHSFS